MFLSKFGEPERYPHGTRARYVGAKCRCTSCRAANTAYYHERQGRAKELAKEIIAPPQPVEKLWTTPSGEVVARTYSRACPGTEGVPCGRHLRKDSKGGVCGTCRELLVWNGLVDAEPVREHLAALSAKGIGYKAVADAASVGRTIVQEIVAGKRPRIRAQSAKRILAVDEGAASDGSVVSSKTTHEVLEEIRQYGLTWDEIAEYFGCDYGNLHRIRNSKRVVARTELRAKKVLAQVQSVTVAPYCPQCEVSHRNGICPLDMAYYTPKHFPTPQDRRGLLVKIVAPEKLKAMDFEDVEDLRKNLIRLYTGKRDAGYQRLHRDLKAIGAVSTRRSRYRDD